LEIPITHHQGRSAVSLNLYRNGLLKFPDFLAHWAHRFGGSCGRVGAFGRGHSLQARPRPSKVTAKARRAIHGGSEPAVLAACILFLGAVFRRFPVFPISGLIAISVFFSSPAGNPIVPDFELLMGRKI
jgi:hypothetical protein